MRSRVLTAVAVLVLAAMQVACGADASSTEGTPSVDEGAATPSQNLASGSASTGPNAGSGPSAGNTASTPGAPGTETPGTGPASPPAGSPPATPTPVPVDPNAGAGPKPTSACSISKNSAGFFTRTSTASSYVAYVPPGYDGTAPMRLIVGAHGCGDDAMNFATWGVNPYDSRSTQDHIGISIGGADGRCWNASDDAKVLAAIDDISSCFWVHQKKVVLAGFSSGGELAYRVGLSQASRFAGILIEDSGLYAANGNPDALLANAAWKLHIAHLTHTSDPVFPLAQVKADWVKTKAAGFPLVTTETPGAHDGTSADWSGWLIPQSSSWLAP